MKKVLRITYLVFLVVVASISGVKAQYYNTGVDAASIHWKQIKNSSRKIIFPSYYEPKARIINGYLDVLTPYISNGLDKRMERFDVILRSNNLMSNGVVVWAPKRMELYTSPLPNQYSMPWLKQLTAHEYRHVSQMSNLNVGFTKAVGYVLGEQIVGLIAAIPPKWFFEGDATLSETQFAMSGRGDQPSFSIGLRAILNENRDVMTLDKLSLGSYRDFTPSPYEYGYYMVAATRRYYGYDFWDRVLRYTGRNPYFIASSSIAYRKFYNTNSYKIFGRTFKELKQFWHNASQEPNSSTLLDVPLRSYTTYRSPIELQNNIIAQKKDLDMPARIVSFDKITGKEKILRYVPWAENKINIKDSVLTWSEYSPSLFWEHNVGSVVRQATLYTKNGDLRLRRPKTVFKSSGLFFPTPVGDSSYVVVEYDRMNNPSILYVDNGFNVVRKFEFKGNENSFNGLAWDDITGLVYYILIDGNGACINSLDVESGEHTEVIPPTYIAYSQISAGGGKLMFNSTESGKDEVHLFDLKQKKEYRLTSSKYGSFDGRAVNDSTAVMTTYTPEGYIVARQSFSKDTLKIVEQNLKLPSKRLVPVINPWDVPKLDTINISAPEVSLSSGKAKRYSKVSHLFKPHSWFPAVIDINQLIDDRELTIGVGATALSQNSLGTMTSIVGYGWVPHEHKSLLLGNFKYTGLPVHIALNISYGGGLQDVYAAWDSDVEIGTLKNYLSVKPELSLPINLSGGSSLRKLEPFVALNYTNSLMYDSHGEQKAKAINKLTYGVLYQTYRPMVAKDLAPRLGYAVRVSGMLNPFNNNFGEIYSVFGRVYLPGVAKHHAWSVAVNYQHQNMNMYNFIKEELFPRGNDLYYAPNNMLSSAINYRLPLGYPDWTIKDFLFIKRFSLNMFGEYARCVYKGRADDNFYTYGVEALVDVHFFRIGGVAFSIGASVYKASSRNKPSVGFLFNLAY